MRFVLPPCGRHQFAADPLKHRVNKPHSPYLFEKDPRRNKKVLRAPALANIPHEIRGLSQKLPSLPRSFRSFLPSSRSIHSRAVPLVAVLSILFIGRPARLEG